MIFTSSDVLDFLSGGYAVREARGPRFSSDSWVIKTADGHDLEADLGGFAFHPVRIPDALFEDFQRAGLVAASADATYRLTQKAKGFAQAA
jgi:hypothetical protein